MSQSFAGAVSTAGLGLALAFGAAGSAQALEMKCKPAAEVGAALAAEGQKPVLKYFFAVDGSNGAPEVSKIIITATNDVDKRSGYQISKRADGLLCPVGKLTNIRLYKNDAQSLDKGVFLDDPKADAAGAVNSIIFANARDRKYFPMMTATREIPALGPRGASHYFVIAANAGTGEGSLTASTLEGEYINILSKDIPATGKYPGVEHGAQFTEYGYSIASVPTLRVATANLAR